MEESILELDSNEGIRVKLNGIDLSLNEKICSKIDSQEQIMEAGSLKKRKRSLSSKALARKRFRREDQGCIQKN